MNTVYKIVTAKSVHYVRAMSAAAARVRAFKVWAEKPLQCFAMGLEGPDIGRAGYTEAVWGLSAAGSNAELRAMQSTGGPDNTGRTFYKVTEKEKVKVENKARAMLKMLGM